MVTESAVERLGVAAFGELDPRVGNFLYYPRRVVLEVLKLLFQQEDLFTPIDAAGADVDRNPFLLKLREDGSPHADSRIVVADDGSEHLAQEESRPRIIVDRGSGEFAGTGFSQKNFTAWAGTNTGQRFSDLYGTSIVVRCVGRVKLESEALGNAVSFCLTMFREEIKKKSDLHHLSPPTVSQTVKEKVDSEVEQYVTTVQSQIQQSVNWEKSKLNPQVLMEVCAVISETS